MNAYLAGGVIVVLVVVGGWWYLNQSNTPSVSSLEENQNSVEKPTKTSSVSPALGNAPLAVNFVYLFPNDWKIKNLAGDLLPARIGIDFGDKTEIFWKEFSVQEITAMDTKTTSHTYTTAGTYTVNLLLDCGKDYCKTSSMGTVTVK